MGTGIHLVARPRAMFLVRIRAGCISSMLTAAIYNLAAPWIPGHRAGAPPKVPTLHTLDAVPRLHRQAVQPQYRLPSSRLSGSCRGVGDSVGRSPSGVPTFAG